jgi:putative PEP-CTERM system TPR-repeat lipoprotein
MHREEFLTRRLATLWKRWPIALAIASMTLLPLTGCGRADPAERLQHAREFLAQQKYNQAQAELNQLIVDGDDTAESRVLLAQVSVALGDYEAADHHLLRAAELGAKDAAFVALHARVLLDSGRFADALALLTAKGAALPAEDRALLEAEASIGAGNAEHALALLGGTAPAASPAPRVRVLRAQALAAKGDIAAARAELNALMEIEPAHPLGSLILADLSLRSGDAAQASKLVDAALAQMPAGGTDPTRASLLLLQADVALSTGRMADAKRSLAELKKSHPNAAATQLLMARIAVLEGNARDAVASLRQMLADQPENNSIRMLLAVSLIDSGNYNQAEQELVSMLAHDARSTQARLALARLQLLQGRLDSAQALLEGGDHGSEESALLGEIKLRLGDNVAAIDLLRSSVAARPREASRALDLAEVYLQAGDAQQASDTLRTIVVSTDAEKARLEQLNFLSSVLSAGSDLGRAIERVVQKAPNDVGLRLLASGVYANALGQNDDARRHLLAARTLAPKNSRVLLALARLETTAGNRDAARTAYLEALQLDKDDVNAISGLAWLAGLRGDRGDFNAWRSELDRLSGPRVRVEAMRLSLMQGDQAGASRAASALLQESPEAAVAAYTIGTVYLNAGMARAAREHLRSAAEARSDVPEYWLKLADAEIALGEFTSAESHLRKALQIRGAWLPATRMLVRLAMLQKNPERAIGVVAELRKQRPEDWALRVLEADTLAATGKYPAAMAAYETALAQDFDRGVMMRWITTRRAAGVKDPAQPLVARVERSPADVTLRLLLANYYLAAGENAAATVHYRRILESQPANALALNNLAWLLFEARTGTLDEAIGLARRARQIEPQSPQVLDTLGWLLHNAGKGPEAVEVLAQAAALAPQDTSIRAHLSEAKKTTPREAAANN